MKPTESIRIQNQNFVYAFLRRAGIIAFAELFIFILVVMAIFMTSCSPVLYTTVGQNVGLFHQKGEVAFSASHSETNSVSGIGVQLAAAVDSSTSLMSSYYSLGDESGLGSGSYFELGAGKFSYNPTSKLCGELIIGMGFGSIENSSSNSWIKINYFKPFIQPSFGISTKIIDIAFTPRIAFVTYTSKSDNIKDASTRNDLDYYYSAKQNTLVFEPGVTVRLGFKNVKLQGQYNHTSFNYSSSNGFDPVDKEFLSVGLHILISNRWDTLK